MKNMFLLLAGILFCISCQEESKTESVMIGPVGLSSSVVELAESGDAVQVRTETGGWWIDSVRVGRNCHVVASGLRELQQNGGATLEKYDWLQVETRAKELLLSVRSGYVGLSPFRIYLSNGEYADTIKGNVDFEEPPVVDSGFGLSQNNVEVMDYGGAVVVQTQRTGWWTASVTFGEESYVPTAEEQATQREGGKVEMAVGRLSLVTEGNTLTVEIEDNRKEFPAYPTPFEIVLTDGVETDIFYGEQLPTPDGPRGDMIRLSSEKVDFTCWGGEIALTTGESFWWFTGLEIDGKRVDGFSSASDEPQVKVEADWLILERDGWNKIVLRATPNTEGRLRTFTIYLEAGDYFTELDGTQLFCQ